MYLFDQRLLLGQVGQHGLVKWLRQCNSDNFKVKHSGESYSIQFRQSCAIIHHACILYQDMTEATGQENCVYTCYENERLQNFKKKLHTVLSVSKSLQSKAEKHVFLHRMHTKRTDINKRLEQCLQDVSSGDEFHQSNKDVTTCYQDILATVENL